MNVNWNAYRMFFYVAYCGTTSAAANELHIAQPAVSHGIKQLEESLGGKLFNRSSHGMELTPLGVLLFKNIAEAVSSIENAERLVAAEIQSTHASITIGVSDVVLQHFLIPYLDAYREEHPDLAVNIQYGKNAEEIMALFSERKIDFAMLHETADDELTFESIPVKPVQDTIFYSAKFADRISVTKLTPSDLLRYPLVMHENSCATRRHMEAYFADNGITVKPVYEYSLNSSIIQQVKRKFALGIMYKDVIEDEIERGSLIELPIDPSIPSRYFYLIKPQKIQRKTVRSLISFILDSKLSEFSS